MENSTTSNGLNNNFIYHSPNRWHSAETDKIDAALLKFHAECPPIPMDGKARISSKDPGKSGYEYSFPEFSTVIRIITPVLSTNKLFIMHTFDDDMCLMEIRHESGQFHAMRTKMVDWQGFGTTSVQNAGGTQSFFRRYTTLAMLGLAAEDIDGQDSGQKNQRREQPKTAQPVRPPAPVLEESVVDAWQSKVNECKVPEDFTRLSKELAELKLDKESPLRKFISTAMGSRMDTLDIEFAQGVYSKKLPTEKQA